MIELGLIGIVTSSAVPRMPSGPALISLIEAAVKWVRSMFSLVSDRELDLAVRARLVRTWSAVGAVNVSVGGVVSTTNGDLSVGIVRVRLVAALVDDPDPRHVVAAVVAGQRRKRPSGPTL